MKKLYKLIAPIMIINMLAVSQALADESTLPLTPHEISKLQSLFSSSGDQVANFNSPPHEHVVWQQAPINVILPIGKERMVSFPHTVAFGYDKTVLPDTILVVQNNNGTLYLTAKSAFATQRVQVRDSNSGQIILLNLSAQNGASDTPVDIVLAASANSIPSTSSNNQTSVNNSQASAPSDDSVSYLTLTRFAVQQLYAPKRLLVQPGNIFRTPMHTTKTVKLLLDGSVITMPLASWRGGDLTVTAVLVRNQLKQANTLDPRNLCGDWRAASFFPQTVLAPARQRQDSTTLFLVSNRSFADSLQSCVRGY